MNYIQIAEIVVAVIALIIIIAKLVWGIKRGLTQSIIKLACVILSIIAAVVLFKLVINFVYSDILDELTAALNESAQINLQDFPISVNALVSFVYAIMGPLVFLVLYAGCSIVINLIGLIIRLLVKILPIGKGLISRVLGATLAVVAGLLAFLTALMPVSGYLKVVPKVYDECKQAEIITDDNADQYIDQLEQGFFLSGPVYAITSPLFKYTTNIKSTNGVKTNAIDEVVWIIRSYPYIKKLETIDTSDLAKVDLTPFRDLVGQIENSEYFSNIFAEVVSVASTKWLNYEVCLGVNLKEQIKAQYPELENSLDGALQKLTTATKDNFAELTNQFIDAFNTSIKLYAYAQKLNDTEHYTTEELNQNLTEIFKELNQDTVDIILPIVSEELLTSVGLEPSQAEVVSTVLEATLNSVVNMDEQGRETEATAINSLVTYANNPTNDPTPVIDALVSSEILLPAIEETVKNLDENSISSSMTLEDKAAMQVVLADYQREHPDVDKEKIDTIKRLFGLL